MKKVTMFCLILVALVSCNSQPVQGTDFISYEPVAGIYPTDMIFTSEAELRGYQVVPALSSTGDTSMFIEVWSLQIPSPLGAPLGTYRRAMFRLVFDDASEFDGKNLEEFGGVSRDMLGGTFRFSFKVSSVDASDPNFLIVSGAIQNIERLP